MPINPALTAHDWLITAASLIVQLTRKWPSMTPRVMIAHWDYAAWPPCKWKAPIVHLIKATLSDWHPCYLRSEGRINSSIDSFAYRKSISLASPNVRRFHFFILSLIIDFRENLNDRHSPFLALLVDLSDLIQRQLVLLWNLTQKKTNKLTF